MYNLRLVPLSQAQAIAPCFFIFSSATQTFRGRFFFFLERPIRMPAASAEEICAAKGRSISWSQPKVSPCSELRGGTRCASADDFPGLEEEIFAVSTSAGRQLSCAQVYPIPEVSFAKLVSGNGPHADGKAPRPTSGRPIFRE